MSQVKRCKPARPDRRCSGAGQYNGRPQSSAAGFFWQTLSYAAGFSARTGSRPGSPLKYERMTRPGAADAASPVKLDIVAATGRVIRKGVVDDRTGRGILRRGQLRRPG